MAKNAVGACTAICGAGDVTVAQPLNSKRAAANAARQSDLAV
ncbi:MAG: hypothetical protein AAFS02_11365 [Pseudomonadota bacterium]